MSESQETPEGPAAVIELLDNAERSGNLPVVTSADIAEYVGCHQETARRWLESLEEDGKLRSDTIGARSQIWYRTDWRARLREETVVAYPDHDLVLVLNPSEDTEGVLSSFAAPVAEKNEAIIYNVGLAALDPRAFTSEAEAREMLSTVLGETHSFVPTLVDRWWDRAGIVVQEDDRGQPVIATETAAETDEIRTELPDDAITGRPDDQTTIVAEGALRSTLNILYSLGTVTNHVPVDGSVSVRPLVDRDAQSDYAELVEPVRRGKIPDVPKGAQVIAIDDRPAVHCVAPRSRLVYVIERGEVVETITIDVDRDLRDGLHNYVSVIAEGLEDRSLVADFLL